jgi:predicted RNA binding protein YcfA (HicA-like mRNA interferase family)
MTKLSKLYERAVAGRRLSFRELEQLLTAFGFTERRRSGSHRIYSHPDADGFLNVQPDGADAKAYQVKELLAMIGRCGLRLRDRT